MEEKIVFEDYDVEIADEDIRGVDTKTLLECKEILSKAVESIENEK